METALDDLSVYFDEGTRIFDAPLTKPTEFADWDARRLAWCEKVEQHLQKSFGLRERNMFRNVVIVQPPAPTRSFQGDDHA